MPFLLHLQRLPVDCSSCVWPQKLLNIIASVLHLGNMQFGEGEEGETYITTETQINNLAKVRTVPVVFIGCSNMHKNSPKRQSWEQMCRCFPAAGCWWLSPRGGTHSQETHCQRRGGDGLLVPVSQVFSCWVCVVRFHNFVSYSRLYVTDDQPAAFWAGGVCPWCLSQGCIWSDLHLVGGEDQPVAGSEGAVTLLLATQRQQWKFHHYVFYHWLHAVYFISSAGWNLPQQ